MAEPPIPATTSPAEVSQSCMIADSERHTASRRCSGSASTSPSWPETSTCSIAARVSTSVDVAVTPPLLICRSPVVGPGAPGVVGEVVGALEFEALNLEPDRAVGQLDTREDTRPMRDHVVRPDRHALAEHRSTGYLGARTDSAAGGDDAVPQRAALADLGSVEDHRTLHRRVRGDRHVSG